MPFTLDQSATRSLITRPTKVSLSSDLLLSVTHFGLRNVSHSVTFVSLVLRNVAIQPATMTESNVNDVGSLAV